MAGTWAKLLSEDQVGRVTRGFIEVISLSYRTSPGRQTQNETKRRFDLCAAAFEEMRGDLQWSIERCLDELPPALRARLDGTPWKPDKRSSWTVKQPSAIVSPHTGRAVQPGGPLIIPGR